ncbi:MAG: esterase family protein, partial [Planctomycetales bacterium]|nr:esterase family protein [Planctomycetales bacterium]
MRFYPAVFLFLLALPLFLPAVSGAQEPPPPEKRYELTADSQPKQSMPTGKVSQHVWKSQGVFPGAIRRYWVYLPHQYSAEHPAALMVFQDGHAYVDTNGDFRVPIVFDNLIAKKQMPVTIGVFIDPGHLQAELPPEPGWRPQPANRSLEYDTLSDAYVRFLSEEILPEVRKEYRITDDPDGHAICGISSGGICAFTAAWQRPDLFRKVLSHV